MAVEVNQDLTGLLKSSIDQAREKKARNEQARRRRADLNASEPAHPFQAYTSEAQPMLGVAWGMSKREVFALHALQGLIACPETTGTQQELAAEAVEFADALLDELAKEPV